MECDGGGVECKRVGVRQEAEPGGGGNRGAAGKRARGEVEGGAEEAGEDGEGAGGNEGVAASLLGERSGARGCC